MFGMLFLLIRLMILAVILAARITFWLLQAMVRLGAALVTAARK